MIRLSRPLLMFAAALAASLPSGAAPATPSLIRERGPLIAIEHVLVIDGTGAASRADRIGSLEAGKRADIVLLDGDLSRDIRAITAADRVQERRRL